VGVAVHIVPVGWEGATVGRRTLWMGGATQRHTGGHGGGPGVLHLLDGRAQGSCGVTPVE
jgi:hypothetical protein